MIAHVLIYHCFTFYSVQTLTNVSTNALETSRVTVTRHVSTRPEVTTAHATSDITLTTMVSHAQVCHYVRYYPFSGLFSVWSVSLHTPVTSH